MAQFVFNVVSSSSFNVERVSTVETDCASVYVYRVISIFGNSIRFSLSGVSEEASYTVAGVETAFAGETTVSYGTDLYISFSIFNSGSSGNFNSVTLSVNNDTSSESYQDPRTRANDNTPCGLLTIIGDKNYVHDQSGASAIWTINHALDKKCSVTVVDSAGTVVVGEVDYTDSNTTTITFNSAFSGYAYCN